MAGSVNKVILLGNVGRDPEFRDFPNGDKVCNLSIATSETWKDKASGERKERTEWHRVAIYNQPLVNIVQRYVSKGTKLYIEGQLETRKYTDKDGNEKYTTEITLRPFRGELTLLDGKGGSSAGASDAGGYEDSAPSSSGRPALSPALSQSSGSFDDDIPF